jgi:hypothetical protein
MKRQSSSKRDFITMPRAAQGAAVERAAAELDGVVGNLTE